MNTAGLMIKRGLQAHHLRHIANNSSICLRQASTSAKINNIVRKVANNNIVRMVIKYNPLSWLHRFFMPGPYPKLTKTEKKSRSGQRIAQFVIFPIFWGGVAVLFYYEHKDRQELMELKEVTYDRRLELSVDRYNASTGEARWDKRKYAKWNEEDGSRVTFSENVPVLSNKKQSLKEFYEAGDSNNTPTLIGQLKALFR